MAQNDRIDIPDGSIPNLDVRIVQFVAPDGSMAIAKQVDTSGVPYSQVAGILFQAAVELAVANMQKGTSEDDR